MRAYTNIGTKNTARVFLDTNVAFDLVSRRQPFYDECAFVTQLERSGAIDLFISSGSISTMIYLACERSRIPNAELRLVEFIETCEVMPATKATVLRAFSSEFRDKEDGCEYYTAIESNADYFLTRDSKDFTHVIPYVLPILSPLQFEYMLL